jgi:hypothetical protein
MVGMKNVKRQQSVYAIKDENYVSIRVIIWLESDNDNWLLIGDGFWSFWQALKA